MLCIHYPVDTLSYQLSTLCCVYIILQIHYHINYQHYAVESLGPHTGFCRELPTAARALRVQVT